MISDPCKGASAQSLDPPLFNLGAHPNLLRQRASFTTHHAGHHPDFIEFLEVGIKLDPSVQLRSDSHRTEAQCRTFTVAGAVKR